MDASGALPATAEEYLQSAKAEARALEKRRRAEGVVVPAPRHDAHPHAMTLAVPPPVRPCPEHLRPMDPMWRRHFVSAFEDLRQGVRRQRALLLGDGGEAGGLEETLPERSPALRPLLRLSERAVRRYVEEEADVLCGSDSAGPLTHADGAFLFALLACLAKPLLPNTAAALRCLLRTLAAERAALRPEEAMRGRRLTVLIAVIEGCFGQR